MDTKIVKVDEKKIDRKLIEEGARLIKAGGLVAFPTETVYGLGADGLNSPAVKKIYEAKGRPSDNPLILHIASREDLYPLVKEVSELAYRLMESFWPGPLTLIFKKSNLVPDIISAGLDSVAIRMPSNPIALELISQAGRPIAAPSANISGRPSPTSGSHVVEDMAGRIDMIIDGGPTGLGLESTVLDISGDQPTILRPGGVSYEDLRDLIPNIDEDQASIDQGKTPRSPGQKYRHYAPEAEMVLFTGRLDRIVASINTSLLELEKKGLKVGIMATEETVYQYKTGLVKVLGSRENREGIAANLFETIRDFDHEEVDIILAEGVDLDNIGRAIMNRMIKAAGGRIINT